MCKHFAVTADVRVLSFRKRADALDFVERTDGAVYASDDAETGLNNVSTPMLVKLYNVIRPEKPITKFTNRETAVTRMKGVLDALAVVGIVPPAPVVEEEPAYVGSEQGEQAAAHEDSTAPASDDSANDAPPTTEEDTMASKKKSTAKKSTAKKSAAKKATTPRAPRSPEIPEATVRKVIRMRSEGIGWPEILKEYGEKTHAFIHRIRPLMKKLDKSSVKPMGPGSPNYGKGKAPAKKRAAKKSS
jgi:hypothetical protein